MANRSKNSAQRSRSPSQSAEEVIESQEELLNSEHEEDLEGSFHPCHVPAAPSNPAGQPPMATGMYMPYIEGPCMDWMVNDNLYYRFLKWCLKCKNILECKLAALPECQQCKKVIAWSSDCGMDQYVSWNLPSSRLTLDTIWGKYEEYCKPQSNEVRARFDLLTSFCQGNRSVDEWYNAIQAQVNLARYPQETAKILHRDIFWFFLREEDFVSRTISDGSIDLDKFLASRVCQLAKKLESSKATARHIKQVSGEPQAAQINLLHHQRTELPQHRYKKKKSHAKPRQGSSKPSCGNDLHQGQKIKGNHFLPTSNRLPPSGNHNRCSKCGDTSHQEGFTCPAKSISARYVINLGTLLANVSKRNNTHNRSLDNQKHIKYK